MNIKQAKSLIDRSERILIFTGAGISKDSDIPTFRDLDGIWKIYNPLLWANKTGLILNYFLKFNMFKKFIIDFIMPISDSKPNEGHFALSRLEKMKNVLLLTQNIDNLHQEAGSLNVYEIHGNILEIRKKSTICKKYSKFELKELIEKLKSEKRRGKSKRILREIFNYGQNIRPNVVLFNETINIQAYNQAASFITNSDLLLIVGTSLTIYPASNIINLAINNHIPMINVGFTDLDCAINIVGKSSDILPKLIN